MVIALLFFVASASADTCAFDSGCDLDEFCDEWNATAFGFGQCSLIDTIQCNGTDISCSSNSDCSGIGSGICITTLGICDINAQHGEPCQLDDDCVSGYCVLSVCSASGGSHVCSSDSDCDTGKTCVNEFCRGWGGLGAYCVNDRDCQSMICDDNYNVCSECESSWGWDGDGHIAEDTFCNINHYSSCSLANPYSTYALENDLIVVTQESSKKDGDSCDDSACCLSNTCSGGICVGIGETGYTSSPKHIAYCEQLDYSLATHYIDGQLYGSPGSPYY